VCSWSDENGSRPSLSYEEAAQLNTSFLQDVAANIALGR
jgi:hypothetical protein